MTYNKFVLFLPIPVDLLHADGQQMNFIFNLPFVLYWFRS